MVYDFEDFLSNDAENQLLFGKFSPLYQNKGNYENSTITMYFTLQKIFSAFLSTISKDFTISRSTTSSFHYVALLHEMH